MMDVARRARDTIQEVVDNEGYELLHVEFLTKGPQPLLRAYIDRPGGVNIDDCAEISRRVSVALDVEDFIPGKYLLEVSSPGIERPLFNARDYRRFTGEKISLTTKEKIENRRNFKGVLKGFEEDLLRVECDGKNYEIPLKLVKKANLVYDFDQS